MTADSRRQIPKFVCCIAHFELEADLATCSACCCGLSWWLWLWL